MAAFAELASHAGVFREARFPSLPTRMGREEKRAPLKKPAWEAIAQYICLKVTKLIIDRV